MYVKLLFRSRRSIAIDLFTRSRGYQTVTERYNSNENNSKKIVGKIFTVIAAWSRRDRYSSRVIALKLSQTFNRRPPDTL